MSAGHRAFPMRGFPVVTRQVRPLRLSIRPRLTSSVSKERLLSQPSGCECFAGALSLDWPSASSVSASPVVRASRQSTRQSTHPQASPWSVLSGDCERLAGALAIERFQCEAFLSLPGSCGCLAGATVSEWHHEEPANCAFYAWCFLQTLR